MCNKGKRCLNKLVFTCSICSQFKSSSQMVYKKRDNILLCKDCNKLFDTTVRDDLLRQKYNSRYNNGA